MIKLSINSKIIEVPKGISILDAAKQVGVVIPTMCHNEEVEHFTSCMICLVKETNRGALIPSCSMKVEDGMAIETDNDEVNEARRVALELLLSEHVGDCEAPCVIACPAHMDIPVMNRFLAKGKFEEALKTVMQHIPLPSVLGRICPAPCEGACHRKTVDEPVSICLLKRFAGDSVDFEPILNQELKGDVAIIGSGPAGLSTAYYLSIKGVKCVVYDKAEQPGGLLRTALNQKLPLEVLDREIEVIKRAGVNFVMQSEIDKSSFEKLQQEYDAVVLASGTLSNTIDWGLELKNNKVVVQKGSYQTNLPKVFAIGNVLRSSRLAVRSIGQGREVSLAIEQMLKGETIVGEVRKFNSRFGKLNEPELEEYLKESTADKKVVPKSEEFILDEVMQEAARCLHCDCREIDNCSLRIFSHEYGASQKRFAYTQRHPVRKIMQHDTIVYEPEKCIKCGICVRLTKKYDEDYGFTFVGRGFDVEISVPFNQGIEKGLQKIALEVAQACPTGALAKK